MTRSPASGWTAGSRPGSNTPVILCWRNCVRASRSRSKRAGACLSPTMAERSRRCWRCTCPTSISTNYSSARNIKPGPSVVGPEYQGRDRGRRLLAFTRQHLPDEIWLRCVRENEKAWRWYEREGFVYEQEQVEPMTGFVMKYYRWKKQGTLR